LGGWGRRIPSWRLAWVISWDPISKGKKKKKEKRRRKMDCKRHVGHKSFFFLFFGMERYLGFNSGFWVARQTMWATSSPFCFGYFGDRVSLFAQVSLDHNTWFLPPKYLGFQAWATGVWHGTPIFEDVSYSPPTRKRHRKGIKDTIW
jgi:hypothetical protein